MEHLPITEAINLLKSHEIETATLQRGTATITISLVATPREFRVLIQRPGAPDQQQRFDEYELLAWWMEEANDEH